MWMAVRASTHRVCHAKVIHPRPSERVDICCRGHDGCGGPADAHPPDAGSNRGGDAVEQLVHRQAPHGRRLLRVRPRILMDDLEACGIDDVDADARGPKVESEAKGQAGGRHGHPRRLLSGPPPGNPEAQAARCRQAGNSEKRRSGRITEADDQEGDESCECSSGPLLHPKHDKTRPRLLVDDL